MIAMNRDDMIQADLIKAYRLLKRMMEYPKMVPQMRNVFLDALEKEGKTSREKIRQEALAILESSGTDTSDEAKIQEIVDILIDFRFSTSFSSEKIENHINFARKQKQFSKLVHVINQEGATYGKIKKELQVFCDIPEGDIFIPACEAEGARVGLINHFISNQLPFIGIAKNHITIRDVGEIAQRIIRTNHRSGKIGGKSAGVILAHRILVPRLEKSDPELETHIRIPESWYINTGIFSDFIARNELYHFHAQKYKTHEVIEKEYDQISDLFEKASFPGEVLKKFKSLLNEIGEHPLVLKSSSLLEENFGYAFSGKYDSVFLANQGDISKRLKEFVRGLKKVHMSTYGPDPLLYRKDHNLLDFDEKMSVLVQKVVGRKFGKYFFPFAAGVGHSYSSYSCTPQIDKKDGVMRLVMGLGTRAVDRIDEDCPRIVHLSNPKSRLETSTEKIAQCTQKLVDVLNLETGEVESKPFGELMSQINHPDLVFGVSENQDSDISNSVHGDNLINTNTPSITFEHLLKKTHLPRLMKKVLKKLEKAYGRAVDIEFVWDGDNLYIVQCRPLPVVAEEKVDLPIDTYKGLLFFKNNRVISGGSVKDLEYLVYINPKSYAALSSRREKIEISKVISRINRKMEDKPYALFGPGRWGSKDINQGIKAGYADINNARVLGEVPFAINGSISEVLYGTHFFNDLVESGILHVAVSPGEKGSFLQENLLIKASNQLGSFLPDDSLWESVINLIHIPSCHNGMKLQ
ncbi:MAG: hypothetical protein GY857_16715, partial [Desulfobacula sp.]|nr:hypothetical protein [Desulfobacula sp.]